MHVVSAHRIFETDYYQLLKHWQSSDVIKQSASPINAFSSHKHSPCVNRCNYDPYFFIKCFASFKIIMLSDSCVDIVSLFRPMTTHHFSRDIQCKSLRIVYLWRIWFVSHLIMKDNKHPHMPGWWAIVLLTHIPHLISMFSVVIFRPPLFLSFSLVICICKLKWSISARSFEAIAQSRRITIAPIVRCVIAYQLIICSLFVNKATWFWFEDQSLKFRSKIKRTIFRHIMIDAHTFVIISSFWCDSFSTTGVKGIHRQSAYDWDEYH